MLQEINRTFIALLPKIANPMNINHYRLISLCNTIYKGAFEEGRLVQENILMANEKFHSFHKNNGKFGWMSLKLDMEKAYNKLDWNFTKAVLSKFEFHRTWVQ